MHSVRGIISAVQEGRFRLIAEDGRVIPFVLSHSSAAEPQDLARLQAAAATVRVGYSDPRRLIAALAHCIEIER